jgi:DnaK suppressor protein
MKRPAKSGSGKPVAGPAAKPGTKAPAPKAIQKTVAKADAKAAVKPGAKAGSKSAPAKKPPAGGKAAVVKSAGEPAKAAKPAPAKKGPIDFTTAKSVAAAAVVATPDAQGYVMINGRRVRVLSAAAVPPKRKVAAAPAAEEAPEPQISGIKTKLSAKDLEDYKQRLLQKRRQVFGMITGMEDEALRSSGGNLSNMPLHMADIGTDTYDQDFTLGMAESERGLLNEIDDALRRIEDRTYGVCQMSGQPIPKARLDAKPWAKYTIESARRIESGQAR